METRRFDQKTGEKAEKGRWKRGEKMENRRKNGKKGREAEEKGGKERKREKGRLGNPEGRRPATRYRWNNACHFPSTFARKATMFEPPRKNTKMRKNTKNAHLSRAHTDSSPQTDRNGTFTGPEGNKCSPLSKNSQKYHKQLSKNDNLMRVQNFRKVSGRFFLRKK